MTRWMLLPILALAAGCTSTPEPGELAALVPWPSGSGAASTGETASPPALVPRTEYAARPWFTLGAPGQGTFSPVTKGPEEERFPDDFKLRAGVFLLSDISTVARMDAKNLPVGTSVDLSKNLALDTSDLSGRVDAIFRLSERSALGASWYSFRLAGSRVIDKTIEWNGETYPINTRVDSFFNQDIYKLNYRYSLYHNADIEFGIDAGFNIQHFKIGLSSPTIGLGSEEALTAPLPVFGFFINHHFTPRLVLGLEYEFFFLDFDNASGSLQDFLVSLEYRLIKNVAIGGAFDFYSLDADYSTANANFSIQQSWDGFMLFASVYF